MNVDRRRLLKLLPASGLVLLAGCEESEEEKVARVERAVQAQKDSVQKPEEAPAPQPTPEEKAAEDTTKKLILYCAANLADPFLRLQSTLMQAAVLQIDGYRFKTLDAAGDAGVQIGQLNKALGERPAFLIVSPLEVHVTAGLTETFRNDGSVVIGLDERLGVGACTSVVFVSQKKLGQQAGQLVVEALKRKAADENKPRVTGRVVHLLGDAASFAAKARSEGFHEALKAETGIVVVHEAPGGWTREAAKARTEEALRLQHEFDVVFAHNDVMAQGASEALSAAQMRERVLIVGMDGGLDMLRKSVIDATIRQPMPMETAFEIIKKFAADKHFEPPSRTEREPEAVTPVNLDEVLGRMYKGGQ